MSDFSAFMKENQIKRENIKFVASKSFMKDGKPIEWEIKAIDNEENEALKKLCTRNVKVPNKPNMYMPEIDTALYMGKLAAACTVFPNLKNAELQDNWGVKSEDALLKKMLSAGEYADYCNKVSEVNGFDVDINEKVEEAKN